MVTGLSAAPARAAESDLEKRVEQLEKQLAQSKDTSTLGVPIVFGGFVDTYYAFDFKQPPGGTRVFTTQPSKHNEFNVNLAFLEAKINQEKYRGRLAFQAGTSVDTNYAAEPSQLAKHIQEAYAGYSPIKNLWIDAGIYLSHLGAESFISRDNWTYTRSLAADYSPYYQTGVRISYQATKEFSAQLHVLNGWQNITDHNSAKAVGMQLAYQPNVHLSLTYNNFIGKEAGDRMRYFHDFIAKASFQPIDLIFQYDLGIQEREPLPGDATWQVYTLLARYQIHPLVSVAIRGERYIDKEQVIVVTNTPNGFQVWGASGNIDVQLAKPVTWRTEYRHFWSDDRIYPNKTNGSRQDQFVVSSLALSF